MIGRALQVIVAAVLLVLACRTFVVMGIATPMVVDGSSMAPALVGPHLRLHCEACGVDTRVGLDQLPTRDTTPCPACGDGKLSIEGGVENPGDRVLVNRLATPRRWDVVVARRPDDAERLCIKRVLGLPGEEVSFRGGDLFVNGRRVAKSFEEQRRLRAPVTAATVASHWQDPQQRWQRSGDTWAARPATGEAATLFFRPSDGKPISDDLAYNQRVSRRLNRLSDLILETQLTPGPGAVFALSVGVGDELLLATFNLPRRTVTLETGARIEKATLPMEVSSGKSIKATLSLFDRQALVAVGDEPLLVMPLPEGLARKMLRTPPTIALTVAGGELSASGLLIHRDLYYEFRPGDRPLPWRLGPDEWLLVGDNQAISHDSRNWKPRPGVSGRLLLGVVPGK